LGPEISLLGLESTGNDTTVQYHEQWRSGIKVVGAGSCNFLIDRCKFPQLLVGGNVTLLLCVLLLYMPLIHWQQCGAIQICFDQLN